MPNEITINSNKIQCRHCNDIIESVHRHNFKSCSCGKVSVDGGKDYLRRLFPEGSNPEDHYIEMSEIDVEDVSN